MALSPGPREITESRRRMEVYKSDKPSHPHTGAVLGASTPDASGPIELDSGAFLILPEMHEIGVTHRVLGHTPSIMIASKKLTTLQVVRDPSLQTANRF
jgi:hypothetical protein